MRQSVTCIRLHVRVPCHSKPKVAEGTQVKPEPQWDTVKPEPESAAVKLEPQFQSVKPEPHYEPVKPEVKSELVKAEPVPKVEASLKKQEPIGDDADTQPIPYEDPVVANLIARYSQIEVSNNELDCCESAVQGL